MQENLPKTMQYLADDNLKDILREQQLDEQAISQGAKEKWSEEAVIAMI